MAEQTLKEKTAKGLFWGGLSNGVQQLLNALFGLVLARVLDASDYGMVGMLAIFSAIASTIQESGFTAALTNQKEIKHEDYNAVFWFSSLTGVLFYLILFFCAPLIAQFYDKPELIGLSRIVFLSFLFGGFGIASNAYMFKMLMVKEKAKIDIISGFLGAGKTTLIQKLLKEALKGEKVVLIENEFGEIGIDGGFLKDSGIEIREMNSGCICCSLVGDFGTSLKEVITTYHPDRIIIEPSGVGKLSDVIKAVKEIGRAHV